MGENILLLNQISQMSAALLAGAFGGLAFDLYQRLCYGGTRRRRRASAYLKGDVLFALILISLWLVFWFTCTDGSLRVLVFIWFGAGLAIYFGIFSKRLDGVFTRLKALLPHPRKDAEKPKNKICSAKLIDNSARIALRMYKRTDHLWREAKKVLRKIFFHQKKNVE